VLLASVLAAVESEGVVPMGYILQCR